MASMESILTQSQLNTIKDNLAKIFIEEQEGIIKIDLNEYKNQAEQIIKAAKYQKEMKGKNFEILNLTARKQALLAKGYLLIMKFRAYLFDEEINYRYYIRTSGSDIKYEKAIEFNEDNIAKYMRFKKDRIVFNEGKLNESDINEMYSSFANYYSDRYMYPDINDYMQLALNSNSARVVRSNIMNQYYSLNPGLKNAKTYKYQLFSRGHIMEAIDISTSEVLLNSNIESFSDIASVNSLMDSYVFGKNLNRDTVTASAGADNNITKTSVKSTDADLYSYYTIVSQLSKILSIIDNGFESEEKRIATFKNLFMDKSKYINEEDFQEVANLAYEKLLKDIEDSIKKINLKNIKI